MGFMAEVLPFIVGGFNQATNAISTGSNNKKSREWQEMMYAKQRQDALSDWNMQNEYNHPSAQMARLRDANLNPNLVYGNGATTTAAPTRGADAGSWRPEAPQFDLSNVLGTYQDIQLKEAQTDNLRSQNTVLLNDAALKAAQANETTARTNKTLLDTEAGRFSLGQSQRLADVSAETASENLRKLSTETDQSIERNERERLKSQSDLATAAESILKSRSDRATSEAQRSQIAAQISNIKSDTTLKELDIQLRKMGITSSDPLWSRVIGRIVNSDDVKAAAKKALETLKNNFKTNMEKDRRKFNQAPILKNLFP